MLLVRLGLFREISKKLLSLVIAEHYFFRLAVTLSQKYNYEISLVVHDLERVIILLF